jgi:L-lysine 6-transaminase
MHSTNPSDTTIGPNEVVPEIKKHVLISGLGLVFDQSRSKGSHFYDAASGRTMLDMYGFFGSLPLGFNHPHFDRPEVREDLLQASLIKVSNSDVYTTQYARFVRTFQRVLGVPDLDRLFLIDGGALAVENALKAAMDWKIRKNMAAGRGEIGTDVLHLRLSFHGRTGYTLSLTNTDPNKTMYFAQFDWPRVSSPAIDFALPAAQRTEKVAADEKAAEAEIMAALAARPHKICAMILEPIQCEGGDRHFRKEWFQTLRRICDQNEMLLIFDEVQTGVVTTGKAWCCQHFGVLPDLLAFGKKAAVCGVMASSKRLDEVPDNVFRKAGRINSTWGSNLTDMVRSIHCMTIIEKENLIENARMMGERFLGALQKIAADEPLITAPRGRGLLLAFDLPDTAARDRLWKSCYAVGLMINRCGSKSIRLRPVLDVKPAAVDEATQLLRNAIESFKRT